MPPVQVERIEQLRELIGRELGPTEWLEITQADIDKFAEVSRDHQWIHVDPERAARESPYGTTVAHGNLTLSLVDYFRSQLIQNRGVKMGINYGFNRVRFPAAVPTGSRVRAWAEVLSVEELGDGWVQVVTKFTIEGEGQEKPVCVAESVGRALVD
jgi:acyl dehydratase